MKNYKKLVLEKNYKKLLLDDINRELTNKDEYSTHVDYLIGENKSNREYLVEGVKVFKIFIEVCRENDWFHKFTGTFDGPAFCITLKSRKQVNNLDIDNLTIESLSKKVDNRCPPRVALYRTMDKICKKYEYSIGEWHSFILPNSALEKIFMEEFNNKFDAEYGCFKSEYDLIINADYYNYYLDIRYREDEKKNIP